MGGDTKDPPFFFQKNADNVVTDGKFPYPSATKDVHFEIEMVVALKSGGSNIKAADAMKHVFGYAVGIDMTRRDLQAEAKKLQRPWEVGKAFEHSAPCTALVPAQHVESPAKGAIWLEVNGVRKQTGDLSQMIWDVPAPDRVPVRPVRAQGRRPDLHRHAVRRRRHQEGRPAQRPRRRRRRSRRDGHLTA